MNQRVGGGQTGGQAGKQARARPEEVGNRGTKVWYGIAAWRRETEDRRQEAVRLGMDDWTEMEL